LPALPHAAKSREPPSPARGPRAFRSAGAQVERDRVASLRSLPRSSTDESHRSLPQRGSSARATFQHRMNALLRFSVLVALAASNRSQAAERPARAEDPPVIAVARAWFDAARSGQWAQALAPRRGFVLCERTYHYQAGTAFRSRRHRFRSAASAARRAHAIAPRPLGDHDFLATHPRQVTFASSAYPGGHQPDFGTQAVLADLERGCRPPRGPRRARGGVASPRHALRRRSLLRIHSEPSRTVSGEIIRQLSARAASSTSRGATRRPPCGDRSSRPSPAPP
jgi:hypothetical protein